MKQHTSVPQPQKNVPHDKLAKAGGPAGQPVSSILEEYVETIAQLSQEKGAARVRDIATMKGVKQPTVIGALRRLERAGLITYEAREYAALTDQGRALARKLMGRHEILARFLREVLRLKPEHADGQACILEHHLDSETVERLTAFVEFTSICPRGGQTFVKRFQECLETMSGERPQCHVTAAGNPVKCVLDRPGVMYLSELRPGEAGSVLQLRTDSGLRKRLIDMGIIPGTRIEVARLAPLGDPVELRVLGYRLTLRLSEAAGILVEKEGHE